MADFRVCIPSPVTHIQSLTQPYVAKDALQQSYPTRTPPDQLQLPPQTFTGDIFVGLNLPKRSPYTAGELWECGQEFYHQPAE